MRPADRKEEEEKTSVVKKTVHLEQHPVVVSGRVFFMSCVVVGWRRRCRVVKCGKGDVKHQ